MTVMTTKIKKRIKQSAHFGLVTETSRAAVNATMKAEVKAIWI